MKSRKSKMHLANFWKWFQLNARAMAADNSKSVLLRELDNRVRKLDPRLSWEIGPGRSKPWQFIVSPNLDRDLRTVAQQIISRAPTLSDWEFHSARQPKEWDFRFELEGEPGLPVASVDASTWSFVLLEYPDGTREILLKGSTLPRLTSDQREQIASIILESTLGEDIFLDFVDEFDLLDELEPRLSAKERSIHSLRDAVMGPTGSVPFGKRRLN
jgi:hypothetical protein